MADKTEVAVAVQTGHGNPWASQFMGLRLTEFSADPTSAEIDTSDRLEAGSLVPTSGGHRRGTWTPISISGRGRPDMLGRLLYYSGLLTVSTSSPAGDGYRHALTQAAGDSTFPWLSWLIRQDSGNLVRVVHDSRVQRIQITVPSNSSVRFTCQAVGLHEQNGTGSETASTQTQAPMISVRGTFSLTKTGGGTLIGDLNSATINLENQLLGIGQDIPADGDEMSWITWAGMIADGTAAATFSAAAWRELHYGGSATAGDGVALDDVTGALDFTIESNDTIPSGTSKRSIRIEIPNLYARPAQPVSQTGRASVKIPIAFFGYKSGSDPLIRATLATNLATLAL